MTNLLALEGCIDTIIGDDLVRGVSGGEKKRVTIGEALVTNARLLCCDEISTGLDAAVTFNIVAALRAGRARRTAPRWWALLSPRRRCSKRSIPSCYSARARRRITARARARRRISGSSDSRLPAEGSGEDVADWFVNLVATPAKALLKGSSLNLSAMSSANATTTKALAAAWRASDERAKTGAEAKDPTLADARDALRPGAVRPGVPARRVGALRVRAPEAVGVTVRNKVFTSARIGSARW